MDIRRILAELKGEQERIEQAITAIEAIGTTGRRGRPAGRAGRRGRRHMSAAARRKISEMMKQRWAERRRKARAA